MYNLPSSVQQHNDNLTPEQLKEIKDIDDYLTNNKVH